MGTNYPGALDTTTNLPVASALSGVELDGDGNANKVHSTLHGVVSEALVQVETKVGTGSSTAAANQVLTGTGSGTTAWGTATVPMGGTGATTLTDGGILVGSGAGAITALAVMTNGQLLIGDGTTDPTAATITADDGLTVSNGAGTIELDLDLMSNGGLEIQSNQVSVSQGISQYDVAQFAASVVDNDFLRVDGTAVEGRSASETADDIGMGTGDSPQFTAVNLSHASANTLTGSSGDLLIESVVVKKVGIEDMWVPAAAMRPAATNPCADIASVDSGGNSGPDLQVLDFDKDSDEHAQFSVAMPKSWDGGNITFSGYWIGLAATTGVAWGLQVKALGDGEDVNVAYGTAVVITDDSQGSATEINISAASGTIACGGAAGDILFCQVLRDVSDGNDDMAGDARLVGLKINYTTSASTDA